MTVETSGTDDIFGKLLALAAMEKRSHKALFRAASAVLDDYADWQRREHLKEVDSLWVRKGDRRSIATVEKEKKTGLRNRRRRSRARGNERRAVQSIELGARRFRRELSATAVLLRALEPGRWYLRSEIRTACPDLPSGSLDAILGQVARGLIERLPNPAWDGKRGTLRPRGTETSPEHLSRWFYKLTPDGEASRAEVLAAPEKWTARERSRLGLRRGRANRNNTRGKVLPNGDC